MCYSIGLGIVIFVKLLDQLIDNVDVVQWLSDNIKVAKQDIIDYGNALGTSYWLAMTTSVIFFALVMMNQMTWYRRHVIKLRSGDRSFLPSGIRKKTLAPAGLMTASFKYAGFQVGYCIWGFLLSFFVFYIGWMVIVTQFILPMKRHELSLLLTLLIKQWPNILIAITMIVVQILIARCCFVASSDSLAIDNRRAYHIFSYFMLFFNIFLGLVSCLLRIIIGLVLGVVFMQRLSKSTLPRSYERRDPGYLSYVSFLLLEHQHSNPALQCFVRLLLEDMKKDLKDDFFKNEQVNNSQNLSMQLIKIDNTVTTKAKEARNKHIRARNRWHLFVTMTMNPSIIKYRIRFLDVNIESSILSDKMKNLLYEDPDVKVKDDNDDTSRPNSSLSLRQRQGKVSHAYSTEEIGENYYVFKGEVEKPVIA
ncbi:stimulated by retinoic acid gene 6 protein-like [Clytia hemisphaerica]